MTDPLAIETQRGYAATKSRNIPRKGAKTAKKKTPNLAFLASWRENNVKCHNCA